MPSASPAAEHALAVPVGEGKEAGQASASPVVPSSASRRRQGKEPPNEPQAGDACYRAKSGRHLTGKRLTSFERFWAAFAFAKGKAEAADAWLDIPALTDVLVDEICRAAGLEARQRVEDMAKGKSPKWGQGWLTARRWEDYAPLKPSSTAQATAPSTPVPRAPTPEELEENRQRALRNAQHMRERGILPGGPPPDRPQRCDFGAAMAHAVGAAS